MAKETSNIETAPPTNIFREVFVSVQNSTNAVLVLLSFYVTNGQWDPSAPNGIPTQAFQVGQGTTPVWGNYTPTPFGAVAAPNSPRHFCDSSRCSMQKGRNRAVLRVRLLRDHTSRVRERTSQS